MTEGKPKRGLRPLRAWRNGLGRDIATPWGRLKARYFLYWVDHGWLRAPWWNFAPVAEGVFRSNQPSPGRLRRYRQMGIHTVLNLRGESDLSPYLFEREACERLGMRLESVRLRARSLPSLDTILELEQLFSTLPRPFVMHCKSGADRASFAAALYLLLIENAPVAEARRHLSPRFSHLRLTKAGILDHFLDRYERETVGNPLPFRDWVVTRYDREAMVDSFASIHWTRRLG